MGWLLERLSAGFRRRGGTALLLAVLAAIVAVVAATTPIVTRAVQQSALDHALGSEAPLVRAVLGNASSNDEVTSQEAGQRASRVTAALRTPGAWEPARTFREQNDSPLVWTAPTVKDGQPKQRVADVPSCADVHFIAGRCPRTAGEVAVAQSTFNRADLRLNQRITMKSVLHELQGQVVGVYDPADANGRLQAYPSSMAGAATAGLEPDVLLAPAAFSAQQYPTTAFTERSLRPRLPLAALPAIRRDLARAQEVQFTTDGAQASTHTVTNLGALLDRIDGQITVVAVILQVIAAGGFALAVIALGAVAQRLGRLRAAEWALPRLRGMPRRRRIAARLTEPLLPLIGGAVIGTAGAVLGALVVSDGATRASVADVVPTAIALATLATIGGAIGFVAVSITADRRPLDEQLQRTTEPRELSRPALVGSAVVVVGAVAAVVALLTTPGAAIGGAGLLAPILIALAVGLLGLQLALLVARRRTRTVPKSLISLVVWRRLSRSPSQAIPGVLLAGAVALGSFVGLTSATADAFASGAADARAAAPTVLAVRTPASLSLLDAVQRADPGGTRALAAEESRLGDGTSSVVAVDTSRLAAVATWRSAWAGMDAQTLAKRLAPAVHPSLQVRGARMRIVIDEVAPGATGYPAGAFGMAVTLQSSSKLAVVELGDFAPSGSHAFSAAIPCQQGCTFVSLAVHSADSYPAPWSLGLRIASIATDATPSSDFDPALHHGAWMSENGNALNDALPIGSVTRPGPDGLTASFTDTIGTSRPAIRVRDTVEPLPVVLGPTTVAERYPGSGGIVLGAGTDGTPLLLKPVSRASALPRLLGDGALVDLRRMLPQIDQSSTQPEEQVWVRGDPSAVERALRREGVQILRADSLAATLGSERSEAGPLSARFALLGAGGALAVVLIALLGSRLIAAPARRRQWASFASGGVGRHDLRRLIAVEFGAPAAAGIVVGALSGAAAFLLALPHLPLADAPPSAPPAGIPIPWATGAAMPAVALIVVLLMTLLVAVTETRDREAAR